jgi:hypothetical protein
MKNRRNRAITIASTGKLLNASVRASEHARDEANKKDKRKTDRHESYNYNNYYSNADSMGHKRI